MCTTTLTRRRVQTPGKTEAKGVDNQELVAPPPTAAAKLVRWAAAPLRWLVGEKLDNCDAAGMALVAKGLLELSRPRWHWVGLCLLGCLVSGLAEMLRPFLIGRCIDLAMEEGRVQADVLDDLLVTFAMLAGCHAAIGLGVGLRDYYGHSVGNYTRSEAWLRVFSKTIEADLAHFDVTHTSELDKVHYRLSHAHFLVGFMLPDLTRRVINIAVAGAMLLNGGLIGGMLLPCMILGQVLLDAYFIQKVVAQHRAVRDAERAMHKERTEAVKNVRTVKEFSCEGKATAAFDAKVDADAALRAKSVGLWAQRQATVVTGQGACLTVFWWLGMGLVLKGSASVGTVTAFCGMVEQLRQELERFVDSLRDILVKFGELKGSFEYLAGKEGGAVPCRGGLRPEDITGEVALRSVHFAYPSRPTAPVLRGLDLVCAPGTVTALCGPSGSGKSSIARLVLGLYRPASGAVMIDGRRLSDLDLEWYHSRTAVVSQEPSMFARSVADNIAFGSHREDVTREEVVAAAKMANAHEFITGFKEGYDAEVGEKGVTLSGGQKQRIAIARAILTNPKILILDEATSALDASSEAVVQDALKKVMVGRTTLVIAHRLSTIKEADNIAVINDGVCFEHGTHADLLARGGVYADLVARQLAGTDGDEA